MKLSKLLKCICGPGLYIVYCVFLTRHLQEIVKLAGQVTFTNSKVAV